MSRGDGDRSGGRQIGTVRRRPRSTLTWVVLALVLAGTAGCGSRLSDHVLKAASTLRVPDAAGGGAFGVGSQTGTINSTQPASSSSAGSSGGPATLAAGQSVSVGGNLPANDAAGCPHALPTVNIGTVGEYSGIFGPDFAPMYQAVQAWVSSVNAHGGLSCHPVRYFVEDDGGDPSVNQSEVQTLVQTDHVIALVQESAPLGGGASVDYLTQQKIPVVGEEGGSDFFYQSPDYFPQATSGLNVFRNFIHTDALYGKPRGLTKLATISCIEAAICSTLYSEAPQLAQEYGLQLVYRAQASLTSPSFTSNCQAAQGAGAQIFFIGLDSNSIERLLSNCAQIGYHPVFSTGGVLATPALMVDPLAEGMVFASATVPYVDNANAEVSAMDAALARYAPGLQPSEGTFAGWLSAALFQLAAAHLSATPTSADILNGLWSIKNNDLQGSTQPLTFTEGQDAPRTICFWVAQIHDKTLVNVGNGQRICE